MTTIKEVSDFIEKASEDQRVILNTLRTLIEKAVPNSIEQFKWSRPVYGTEKDFCYLAVSKKHVTLGFMNFQKIDDHENLLKGTGKQMRHIKIFTAGDIQAKLFSKMLQQASVF